MNDITKAAIEITGLGMAGIFLFMVIFYFVIRAIDKFFPAKTEPE
ncbi:MAG TPA: OadG-related small transporter subunit [Niabella sp.]|jgi:Na+-transporting methylmalonyl-CoA/oxaloacetate decarboxylase gamma subunit|nr:OadG-related small transporter subunit [Niabella sp.]HRO84569.1 OadG-related small transporter subunit [Niabella sp.]